MSGTNAIRAVLAAFAVLLMSVGAVLLLRSGLDNMLATFWWLAGGVAVHDALLAPLTIVLVVVVAHLLPNWLRTPASVGFVVLATVTVVAVPVLGRFGARPDNATLLDRNYIVGWLTIVVTILLAVFAAAFLRRPRRESRGSQ